MELGADRNSLAKLGAALAILAIVVYLQFFRDESPPPMQSGRDCEQRLGRHLRFHPRGSRKPNGAAGGSNRGSAVATLTRRGIR